LNWAPLENTTVLITNFSFKSTSQAGIVLKKKAYILNCKREYPQKVLRDSSARGVTPQLFSGCEADGDSQSKKTS
jgi:hypothetical protein